jgi:hypothetical protein
MTVSIRAYVVTSDQLHDRLSVWHALRTSKALHVLVVAMVLVLSGQWGLAALALCAGAFMMMMRAIHFWPGARLHGMKHCFLVYPDKGWWHRTEYIAGIGVLTEVVTRGKDLIRSSEDIRWIAGNAAYIDMTEIQMPMHDRRTGFAWYPRTSAGYLAHRIGCNDPRVVTPADLVRWCQHGAEGLPGEKLRRLFKQWTRALGERAWRGTRDAIRGNKPDQRRKEAEDSELVGWPDL